MMVSEFLVEALIKAGVERLYGIVGTSVLDFYDALYNYSSRLRVVTVRHEQTAVSAADAEFRSSWKLSGAVVHAGPGFLNSAIALGIAMKDRVPLIVISGGVKRRLRGSDAWLEVNQKAVADGIVKTYEVLENEDEVGEVFSRVYRSVMSYPIGPGVIEVPEDLWKSETFAKVEDLDLGVEKEQGNLEYAERVLEVMVNSRKPAILACGELVRKRYFSQEKLKLLAEKIGAFVITSGNGRGALSEDDDLSARRVGFGGGNIVADRILEESDALLVLGNELDDITTYGYAVLPKGEVFVVSQDPSSGLRPTYFELITADPVLFMERMVELAGEMNLEGREEWRKEVAGWETEWKSMLDSFSNKDTVFANPGKFFDELDRKVGRERIVVAGQGTHVIFANNNLRVFKPGSYLSATNLGAMSYALPAGIGAKLANPDKEVIVVAGDGEIMMTIQELETVRREKVDVKVVVVNDNSYRVLYIKQVLQKQGRVFQTLLGNPDFVDLAESFGIPAMRVEMNDQIEKGVEFLLEDGARLIELVIDRDEIPPLNLEATLRMGSV